MKKKYIVATKDRNDWISFTKKMGSITVKEVDSVQQNLKINKVQDGYKKLLIITGKGLKSKSHNNPYLSEKLNVLKYSVPEYITNNENLINKISKISKASLKDGGEGAIYIFLKNNKNFKE